MSSMASELYGAGGFIPYGAAKGGIDVLTMGLGKEVAAEGIRVTGLRPVSIKLDGVREGVFQYQLDFAGRLPALPAKTAGVLVPRYR